MKNVLLFALCWLLPLSYSIAQKTLTPSAQKVTCELSAKTRNLFQVAGFKLTAGKVLENQKTSLPCNWTRRSPITAMMTCCSILFPKPASFTLICRNTMQ
ncbi:MAG: hypothetical protein IPN33_09375 [Saprospiraceae bacterium]|nr:hypothetical protein [Saprospiraceae bacterium]